MQNFAFLHRTQSNQTEIKKSLDAEEKDCKAFRGIFCQIAFNQICVSDMIDTLCLKYCQRIIDANTILHFLTRHLSKL